MVFLSACTGNDISNVNTASTKTANVANSRPKLTPTPEPDQPIAKCKTPKTDDERRVCDILFKGSPAGDIAEKITYSETDLNGDKKSELIAWESSWVGQYGSRVWIMENLGSTYKTILERSMSWSPVILLETKSEEGWHDIAFRLDGTSSPSYIKVMHSGVSYAESPEMLGNFPPDGTVLIGSL